MTLPFIANHFRTLSKWSNIAGGNPWTVTLDYKSVAGAPDTHSALGAGQGVQAAWQGLFTDLVDGSAYNAHLKIEVKLTEILIYDLDSIAAAAQIASGGVPAGTNSATKALPPEVCVVGSKRTDERGRRNRGRMYLSGYTVNAPGTDGMTSAAFAADLGTRLTSRFINITDTAGNAYKLVVISQADVPDSSAEVTKITVDRHFDTQRRRGLR